MGKHIDHPEQGDLFGGTPFHRGDGLALAKLGRQRAAYSAERAHPGWNDKALALFEAYARKNADFTTEDVRYANPEFEAPPEMRAWGSVARRASALGIVKSEGVTRAQSNSVHSMWVTNWKSLIYEETSDPSD